MKATIFGAGKIARGFLGQILEMSGYEICFVDANKDLVNLLNTDGKYMVHILGDESKSSTVSSYEVLHIDEQEKISQSIKESDVIFVSVGGNALKAVGTMIGTILEKYGLPDKEISIITCENVKNAATVLDTAIYENVSKKNEDGLRKLLGICESVVMRTATIPSPELLEKEPLSVWVQNYWELPIDAEKYKGPELFIKGLKLKQGFGNLLTQKMYTNNTSNAVIAYNGHLLGYKYLSEAANSPEVSDILDLTYPEINKIMISSLGVSKDEQEDFSKNARAKYEDPIIIDRITRHAKDPIRKLSPNERLIGPAKLALENDIVPNQIIDTIAKAIFYYDEEDTESHKLKEMRETNGVSYIIENVCGVEKNSTLYQLIIDKIKELEGKGIII